jgi:hypothetical protein
VRDDERARKTVLAMKISDPETQNRTEDSFEEARV